jgi:hypothetical protein
MNLKNSYPKSFIKLIFNQEIREYISSFPFIRFIRLYLRFNKLIKPNLDKQLKNIFKSRKNAGQCIIVPILETSHYRVYHHLILAKALEIRGAKVKVLICGEFLHGCELININNINNDPCLECRFNIKKVLPLFNLDYIYLKDIIDEKLLHKIKGIGKSIIETKQSIIEYNNIDIAPVINDSVSRFYYGDIKAKDEEYNKIKYDHLVTNIIGIEVAEFVRYKYKPTVILGYMAAYSVWAPYKDYFEKIDIPVINVMSTQFNYHSVQVNPMDLFISDNRYLKYVNRRNSVKLNNLENKELYKFFDSRINGTSDSFSEMKKINKEKKINFNTQKHNIVLFSNISWDVGMYMLNKVFENINHWIYETIRLIDGMESIHLYIKTHPMEKKFPGPGVFDHLKNKMSKLPQNVSIITPEMGISPYSLIKDADLITVYNGTLGLESLYLDKPVVVCGLSPYGGPGLAVEIDDLTEYKYYLHNPNKVSKPNREEVKRFAYFYFIKQQIPWELTDRVYRDNFTGYNFNSLDDLLPGKDKYLDHLCDCVLDPVNSCPEDWRT